jgi:biotin carboxyl carrier protein
VALQQAAESLWVAASAAGMSFTALLQAAAQRFDGHADYDRLCQYVAATTADITAEACSALLRDVLGWLCLDVPAITSVITILESTQLHTLLTVHDDLSLSRPAYLEDDMTLTHLHRVLSKSLRPTILRHGELLAPMEATIYHQPEPGAPPFVEIGEEIKVGQTLALLEAMKMFTELPSPVDGVLADILVESGQGVKTGEPLFKIATQEAAMTTADTLLHQVVGEAFKNRFGVLLPATATSS